MIVDTDKENYVIMSDLEFEKITQGIDKKIEELQVDVLELRTKLDDIDNMLSSIPKVYKFD